MNAQYSKKEEDELLYGTDNQKYQGEALNFKNANRFGDEDEQDLTESEILVKSMQEVLENFEKKFIL